MGTRWHYCIIISYIVINYSTAKPFSLNKALAEESQQKQITETSSSTIQEKTAERFSLNKVLKPPTSKAFIFKEADNIFSRVRNISPLKYRKTFEIKTPLKPKINKRSPKTKIKRKNISVKREINGNEQLNRKYIPLLKSIGMLFDNLLITDESSSYERKSHKYKRNRYKSIFSEEGNGVECTCTHRSNNEDASSKSPEKTVAIEASTTEISIDSEDVTFITTTTETAYNTSTSDFSSIGYHQNVSLLFPRDTIGSRRNYNGISEGGSSTYNRSVERNLTGDYGNSKYNAGCGKNESFTKNGHEIACHDPRISTSGNGSHGRRRNGNNTRSSDFGHKAHEASITTADEDFSEDYGYAPEYKEQDKLEMGGNKTESAKSLSELIRRLRGYVSEIEVTTSTYAVQPEKVHKESVVNVAHNIASYKRISNGGSPNTEEDKTIGSRNETMNLTNSSINSNIHKSTKSPPVLMIIDGYSVTRHKNGENKLSKKAIHIHS